ncbi:MAG: hypothetical protein KAG97_11975 [Victivallales bacterium]|nr:hypothetical protein [Victivallales bacterium]
MDCFTSKGVPVFEKPREPVEILPIEKIDDFDMRLKRQDAFWDLAIIDRPVIHMTAPAPTPYRPMTERNYDSIKDRWFDADYIVEKALHTVANTRYLGDALPLFWPNLGPEVFSAYFGTELEYSETTSWAIPNLQKWIDVDKLKFSPENFYWRKNLELTDALLAAGEGLFHTGYTDLHPGGDALAAFRDPLNLNLDMMDERQSVKSLLKRTDEVFADVFNFWCDKLEAAGQPIGTWAGIVSPRKSHIPSNDFSCMISTEMFEEFFLSGIIKECENAEASIYHLDGPGALRHLDALLEINSLNAIQWVWGAGNGRVSDWLEVFQRCQNADKGLQITCQFEELDLLIENLRPEGVWLRVGIDTAELAEQVISKISKWK